MLVMGHDEMKEFIDRELVYIKNYIRDAPTSLFIAFKNEFDGLPEDKVREKQKELYEMYLNSTDKNVLSISVYTDGCADVILKPSSFRIFSDGTVVLITRGGSKLIGEIEQFGRNKHEVLNNIADWMYVSVSPSEELTKEYGKDAYRIDDVVTLSGRTDVETADRLLSSYDLTPAEILIAGLGILPTKEILRIFMPRLLSMFYYLNRPTHIIQFTNVETGKTEFGTRLEFIFAWTFYSEFPSVAELVYDGRTGNAGSVFTSNGIVIDELDKVSKAKFVEAYQPLNTGLENGIWRRGVSIQGRKLEVHRRIPFLIFGNCTQGNDVLYDRLFDNARSSVKQIIDIALRQSSEDTYVNINSFLDRFSICDVFPKYVPISDYVITNEHHAVGVLPDSVIRGIVQLVQDRIPSEYVEPTETCKGRMRRHAEAVYNICSALLEREIDIDIVREVVTGDRDFGHIIEYDGSVTSEHSSDHEDTDATGNEYETQYVSGTQNPLDFLGL